MNQYVQNVMQVFGPWVAALSILSVALLAATVFATPWLVARLPQDYFTETTPTRQHRGLLRIVVLVARNLAGTFFLLLGVVMLITPGPGLIGILLGLTLCEFPGRRTLIRRLAGHPRVYRSLNWLRRRQNKAPFDAP